MSALRDGESRTDVGDITNISGDIDTSGDGGSLVEFDWGSVNVTSSLVISGHHSFWRRLWFLVSCIPRYLITGSVEVP